MMPYLMAEERDCGPAALAAVLEYDLETIKRVWGWRSRQNLRDDLNDSPWKHFEVLSKLGKRWKIRTCGDVLNDRCAPGKTIMLVHGKGVLGGIFAQHYVIYGGRSDAGHYNFHWGNGSMRELSGDDVQGFYSRGTPACCYEVVTTGGQSKLSWFQRFYASVMGKFA